ncbi:hypothetical protein OSB04_015042 [Centaurea solstitialis]|uniref:DUF674 family protein n=1 Tax=Centaurea solstitialis TaxID=347529 RepID=A0AA38W8J8_9ASTR|nr:hypothetical protein OSB04_015042 [Centaurea solstitialis]
MAFTTVDEANVSIKVLVDTKKDRVVYAIADHNFVDVLFSFTTLPIGAIVRLFRKQDNEKFAVFGSLNNLFQSLINLPVNYLFSEECKVMLLNPISSAYNYCSKLKLNIDETLLTKYFTCNTWKCNRRTYTNRRLSACNSARCMDCGKLMNREVRFKHKTSNATNNNISNGVFVSDITTYIVTDDLSVMPYTPGCCIQLLRDVGVTDTGFLEERSVDIGREQILDLLRFALSFSSPLTYLVLRKTHPFRGLVHLEQKIDQVTSIEKGVSSSDPKMFLHVSLQKSTGKLLFAEAEEDFIDFVFGFLAISLGTLTGDLMNGSSSLVCMDNLYRSISTTTKCLTSEAVKHILLPPQNRHKYKTKKHIFPSQEVAYCPTDMVLPPNEIHKLWGSCFLTFKDKGGKSGGRINDPRVKGELFKHSGMFIVANDLVITPCSSVSTMDILKRLKVPVNDIEKHKVSVGLEEGLRMLKASLRSSSVLSIGLEHQLKKTKVLAQSQVLIGTQVIEQELRSRCRATVSLQPCLVAVFTAESRPVYSE